MSNVNTKSAVPMTLSVEQCRHFRERVRPETVGDRSHRQRTRHRLRAYAGRLLSPPEWRSWHTQQTQKSAGFECPSSAGLPRP